MAGLIIPLVRCADGIIRGPNEAGPHDGPFECGNCGQPVYGRCFPKPGVQCRSRPHFSHNPDPDNRKENCRESGCRGEGPCHWLAKHLIADNPCKFQFDRKCCECKGSLSILFNPESLASPVTGQTEVNVETEDGLRRVDAMIRTNGQNVAAIEIWRSNPIGRVKRTQLVDIYGRDRVFEVRAEDVVAAAKKKSGSTVLLDQNHSQRCLACERQYELDCDQCGKAVKQLRRVSQCRPFFVCQTCAVPCGNCDGVTSDRHRQTHDNLCSVCWANRRRCEDCGSLVPSKSRHKFKVMLPEEQSARQSQRPLIRIYDGIDAEGDQFISWSDNGSDMRGWKISTQSGNLISCSIARRYVCKSCAKRCGACRQMVSKATLSDATQSRILKSGDRCATCRAVWAVILRERHQQLCWLPEKFRRRAKMRQLLPNTMSAWACARRIRINYQSVISRARERRARINALTARIYMRKFQRRIRTLRFCTQRLLRRLTTIRLCRAVIRHCIRVRRLCRLWRGAGFARIMAIKLRKNRDRARDRIRLQIKAYSKPLFRHTIQEIRDRVFRLRWPKAKQGQAPALLAVDSSTSGLDVVEFVHDWASVLRVVDRLFAAERRVVLAFLKCDEQHDDQLARECLLSRKRQHDGHLSMVEEEYAKRARRGLMVKKCVYCGHAMIDNKGHACPQTPSSVAVIDRRGH
jgi:hypothetical protein